MDELLRYLDTLPATQDPDCTGTAGDIVRTALAEARREERERFIRLCNEAGDSTAHGHTIIEHLIRAIDGEGE